MEHTSIEPLVTHPLYCAKCDASVKDGEHFCGACGSSLHETGAISRLPSDLPGTLRIHVDALTIMEYQPTVEIRRISDPPYSFRLQMVNQSITLHLPPSFYTVDLHFPYVDKLYHTYVQSAFVAIEPASKTYLVFCFYNLNHYSR